jgi:hypothetical protein
VEGCSSKKDGRGPAEILKLPVWTSNSQAHPSDLAKKKKTKELEYKKIYRYSVNVMLI